MSISALSISRVFPTIQNPKIPSLCNGGSVVGGVVECSSRPQKKATSHHMKTRPRKSQPWDIKRKPTVYAPLPPLPPDWTLSQKANLTASAPDAVAAQEEEEGED